MTQYITISVAGISATAELNDSPSAAAIRQALPIEAEANTWGDEVYFSIGVDCPLTGEAREEMAVGEIAYWPPGKAFCIFFGPTPASGDDGVPKAAGKVNPLGRLCGDPALFNSVSDGDRIRISLED